ncbi:M24 family metallopeptidase [Candidatus Bathyarchaeota archaeon]|nr:M24 family metallopeptidase [Candidatus Bathyarchaeota archaeon]
MEKDPAKSSRVREHMEKHDLDVIISRFTENVLYFTNVYPITGWATCFIFRDEDPVLFLPDSEMDFTTRAIIDDIRPVDSPGLQSIKKAMEAMEIETSRVGLELTKEGLASSHLGYEVAFPSKPTFDLVKSTLKGCEIVDATPAIDEMRECKTDFELEQYKLVNELNYYGLQAASELLHVEGISEMRIATECEKAIMDSIENQDGVDFIRSYAFVMAGPNGIKACRPYNISTAYKCKKGEFVMLELNTHVNGYWSDLTRTWVCGRRPTETQQYQADAVNEAIDAALAVMLPGNPWLDAYNRSREAIKKSGFGELHTPFLGHGIGVKLHEKVPMMHDQVDPSSLFKVGNYCSVEPGLYLKKMGALRFERNVAITQDGAEIFDEFPCLL